MSTPIQYRSSHFSAGFTLLEMLIVVVIFLVLTAGTVVLYTNFLYRQQALQSAKNVQEAMRTAQKKARIGEKPAGCVSANRDLTGYRVVASTSDSVVTIYAVCRNGAVPAYYPDSSLPLIGSTRLQQGLDVTFGVITGGVTGAGEVILNSRGEMYAFQVDAGGYISEGEYR